MTVKNCIVTERAKVQSLGWGDFVFEENYDLMPLPGIESYVKQLHKLPGMPSSADIEAAGGLDIGEITLLKQVKIEGLFLHLFALEAQVRDMEKNWRSGKGCQK